MVSSDRTGAKEKGKVIEGSFAGLRKMNIVLRTAKIALSTKRGPVGLVSELPAGTSRDGGG
jgi:hypothetical protein